VVLLLFDMWRAVTVGSPDRRCTFIKSTSSERPSQDGQLADKHSIFLRRCWALCETSSVVVVET